MIDFSEIHGIGQSLLNSYQLPFLDMLGGEDTTAFVIRHLYLNISYVVENLVIGNECFQILSDITVISKGLSLELFDNLSYLLVTFKLLKKMSAFFKSE